MGGATLSPHLLIRSRLILVDLELLSRHTSHDKRGFPILDGESSSESKFQSYQNPTLVTCI